MSVQGLERKCLLVPKNAMNTLLISVTAHYRMLFFAAALFGVRHCSGYEFERHRVNNSQQYLQLAHKGCITTDDGEPRDKIEPLRLAGNGSKPVGHHHGPLKPFGVVRGTVNVICEQIGYRYCDFESRLQVSSPGTGNGTSGSPSWSSRTSPRYELQLIHYVHSHPNAIFTIRSWRTLATPSLPTPSVREWAKQRFCRTSGV